MKDKIVLYLLTWVLTGILYLVFDIGFFGYIFIGALILTILVFGVASMVFAITFRKKLKEYMKNKDIVHEGYFKGIIYASFDLNFAKALMDSEGNYFELNDNRELEYFYEGNWIPGKLIEDLEAKDYLFLNYNFVSNEGAITIKVEEGVSVFRTKYVRKELFKRFNFGNTENIVAKVN